MLREKDEKCISQETENIQSQYKKVVSSYIMTRCAPFIMYRHAIPLSELSRSAKDIYKYSNRSSRYRRRYETYSRSCSSDTGSDSLSSHGSSRSPHIRHSFSARRSRHSSTSSSSSDASRSYSRSSRTTSSSLASDKKQTVDSRLEEEERLLSKVPELISDR